MSTYSDLLKDPRWQKKRLEILQRDNFHCCQCGSSVKTLHVHHQYYTKGNMPWEYPDDTLITLCLDCHESTNDFDWKSAFLNLRLTNQQLLELAVCTKHYLLSRQKEHESIIPKQKYNYTPAHCFMNPWLEAVSQDEFDEYYRNFKHEYQKTFIK